MLDNSSIGCEGKVDYPVGVFFPICAEKICFVVYRNAVLMFLYFLCSGLTSWWLIGQTKIRLDLEFLDLALHLYIFGKFYLKVSVCKEN
ncbi:hypothetical protein CEXT_218801 [Caerostris extrusa]|uniref:Uncharacterized protein n=1 Tax=Caerostris extrusa TaxID=172846 RepID=A0AAV4VMI4_CAEEX|nr:hypothetical protein CEXT_218801 [Caerostris extrusa]